MRAAVFSAEDLTIETVQRGRWAPIVDGVSFSVARGEVIALIGESGSGKTTLGLAALGYTKPGCRHAGGRALLGETDIFALSSEQKRRLRGARVAYLAQSAAAAFNPALTIGEQVIEIAQIHRTMTRDEARERAQTLYRALELPDPDKIGRRYPHEVSGGQLQRLMAAMALCSEPELLVLDEPTTALDVTTQIEVLQAFKRVMREEGAAAIYITHDLALVAQIADQVVVLQQGVVREAGSVKRIVEAPIHPYTRKLMEAVRLVGAEEHRQAEGMPVLEIRDLTAGYGGAAGEPPQVTVLHDIELAIGRGQTLGVIGESGCGKSTLARVVAGALPPASGEIRLNGAPVPPLRRQRSRDQLRRAQFVFQMADTALNPRQKIAEVLGRPLRLFHGLRGGAQRRRVAELLDLVELPAEFAERYPPELSGGEKQRVNLARALAAEPDVVLCDEVTSALDVVVGAAVIELLKQLRTRLGLSYMFISHDISTVSGFSDRIAVLYAGRVVEEGASAEVLEEPFHPYTRLLLASVPELRLGWLDETVAQRETRRGAGGGVLLQAAGCPFHTRCPFIIRGTCEQVRPPIREPRPGHRIACHLPREELPA